MHPSPNPSSYHGVEAILASSSVRSSGVAAFKLKRRSECLFIFRLRFKLGVDCCGTMTGATPDADMVGIRTATAVDFFFIDTTKPCRKQ